MFTFKGKENGIDGEKRVAKGTAVVKEIVVVKGIAVGVIVVVPWNASGIVMIITVIAKIWTRIVIVQLEGEMVVTEAIVGIEEMTEIARIVDAMQQKNDPRKKTRKMIPQLTSKLLKQMLCELNWVSLHYDHRL